MIIIFIFVLVIGMNRADHPTSRGNSTLFSFPTSWNLSERNIVMSKKIDIINQRFGQLLVIKECGSKHKEILWECIWECICDCGKTIYVVSYSLRSGGSKSCGCLRKD